MNEYNQYVLALNKIYDSLNIMKEKWPDTNNINYIKKIEEYKKDLVEYATMLKNSSSNKVEELSK